MFNPPNNFADPGSYVDLLKRITQHVQQVKVDNQILEIMQQVVEKELDQQKLVLSSAERKYLVRKVTKTILTDVLVKIEGEK